MHVAHQYFGAVPETSERTIVILKGQYKPLFLSRQWLGALHKYTLFVLKRSIHLANNLNSRFSGYYDSYNA